MKFETSTDLKDLSEIFETLQDYETKKKELQTKKNEQLNILLQKITEQISIAIANVAGQKVAVYISGEYDQVYGHDVLKGNLSSPTPFRKAYIAQIDPHATGLHISGENLAYTRQDYQIPTTKLYEEHNLPAKFLPSQQELYLHLTRQNHGGSPNWSAVDLLYSLLPADVLKSLATLFPEDTESRNRSHIKLYIGDEEFKEFLQKYSEDQQREILELLDNSEENVPHSEEATYKGLA